MIVKVCGMREADNIRQVEALGVDWIGLIFWPKSGRYVSKKPDYLPAAKRVGVFVDAIIEDVVEHIHDYRLDLVQLHGQESPDYIAQLRSNCQSDFHPSGLVNCGTTAVPRIIKAFNIATVDDLRLTSAYEGKADYFLFDTKGKAVGGNGTKFDWSVLTAYDGNTPFLLSGGIAPDDAGRVKDFHHPQCIGIDLNSCFETIPGVKDINKLKKFIKQIRTHEQD